MIQRSARMLAVVAVILGAAVVLAGVANKAPESVVLDKASAKKPPVTFPHKAHLAVAACSDCHHTQKGLTADSTAEVKPCAACHLDPEKPDTPSMREMSLTKNPFHKQCIDCHKQKAKGPTKCADCHKAA